MREREDQIKEVTASCELEDLRRLSLDCVEERLSLDGMIPPNSSGALTSSRSGLLVDRQSGPGRGADICRHCLRA
jgi:hypothetical protein